MTKEERKEYYRELQWYQNGGLWDHVDIMTITGFMNDEQKIKHLEKHRELDKKGREEFIKHINR